MSYIRKISQKMKQKGNALLYFAIILVLGSLVALTAAKYYGPKKSVANQQVLEQKLNKIAQAISVFVGTYQRLPCPASLDVATGNTNFGAESISSSTFECNAAGIIANTNAGNVRYLGGVPSKTLGLDDSDVVDPWGNKIEYAVSSGMYRNKTQNSTNNYYTNTGAFKVQDAGGNTLESAAAYVLISRGANQLGAWPATGTNQIQLPALGQLERTNLGCLVNSASCGGANFGSIFVSSPDIIDDVLLYRNKNGINTNCQSGSTNASCNNVPCSTSSWTVAGSNTFTVNTSNLPTLSPFPANILAQQGMGYSVTLNLNSLSTTSGSFQLMYTYKTTSSSTVQTVQIAEFSSSSFYGQYDSTYVGKAITIPFGASNHIPQSLYFAKTSGMSGSMTVANVMVNVASLYYKNLLNYEIWKGICSICTCSGSGKGGGCGCDTSQGQGNVCGNCSGGSNNCLCPGSGCGCDTSSGQGNVCGNCLGGSGTNTCGIGNLLSNTSYPNNPSYQSTITFAQGFTSYGTNYFSRISGYFTPDETAQYTFYIATDDNAILYVSPDSNPANAVAVAARSTASAPLAWTAAGATTYTVTMTTGKSYYFYVLQQAALSATDNLAIGCAKTNSSGTTPIAILGTQSDTNGCGGTLSTAPMLSVLNQVQCQ